MQRFAATLVLLFAAVRLEAGTEARLQPARAPVVPISRAFLLPVDNGPAFPGRSAEPVSGKPALRRGPDEILRVHDIWPGDWEREGPIYAGKAAVPPGADPTNTNLLAYLYSGMRVEMRNGEAQGLLEIIDRMRQPEIIGAPKRGGFIHAAGSVEDERIFIFRPHAPKQIPVASLHLHDKLRRPFNPQWIELAQEARVMMANAAHYQGPRDLYVTLRKLFNEASLNEHYKKTGEINRWFR